MPVKEKILPNNEIEIRISPDEEYTYFLAEGKVSPGMVMILRKTHDNEIDIFLPKKPGGNIFGWRYFCNLVNTQNLQLTLIIKEVVIRLPRHKNKQSIPIIRN